MRETRWLLTALGRCFAHSCRRGRRPRHELGTCEWVGARSAAKSLRVWWPHLGHVGAGLVTSNDFDAVLLNMCGLAAARKRLSIGNVYGKLTLRIDGNARDVEPANGFVIGGVVPIAFGGTWRDRVTLGIGFYV